jgi:hypothetical protein
MQKGGSRPFFLIDGLLAGCILALTHRQFELAKRWTGNASFIYLLPLLILPVHSSGGLLNYMRPYSAMLMIGATLLNQKIANSGLIPDFCRMLQPYRMHCMHCMEI